MNIDQVLTHMPPWLYRVEAASEDLDWLWRGVSSSCCEAEIYRVHGGRCSARSGCYAEFSRALALPGYFGNNLDALEEVLRDGDILHGNPILIVVEHAQEFLSDEPVDFFRSFLGVLEGACEAWSRGLGWPSSTDPVAFHVCFLFSEGKADPRFAGVAPLNISLPEHK